MAQLCVRPKGDPHCPLHPKQNVILKCKDCPGHTLVCQTCIISIHEGHKLGDLQEGFTQKVENIKQFITKTETLTMPQLIADIYSIPKKKMTTTEMFQSEIRTAREQAEQLRELVDLQMTKTVSSLEFELNEYLSSLDRYQKELEQTKSKLDVEIKETKTALTSDSNILVLDVETEIMKKSDDCIPPSPNISVPHFVPCNSPLHHVEKAFGDLDIQKTNPKRNLSDDSTNTATLPAATGRSKHAPSLTSHAGEGFKPREQDTIKRILDQPKQLSKLNWRYEIMSLCPIPNNMAWVYSAATKELDLINDKGAAQKIMTLDTELREVCLHPNTGDVYGCCQCDKSVRHVNMQSKGDIETTVLFHTDSEPWSIACTNHNVIVGMREKMCLYTYKGHTVYSKYIGQFLTPFYTSVCNRTSRVVVACGFNGVLVLDNTLNVLYIYRGEGAAAGDVKRVGFLSFCAMFDDNGYLLVGDCGNKEVHVLDDTAKYISTIKTKDMTEVRRLGARGGVLWLGCTEKKGKRIVIIKYMS